MGNVHLDPKDKTYYGYFESDGSFHRLGKMPTMADIYASHAPDIWEPNMHYSSPRQKVQYEHVMKSTGIPFGKRDPLYGDFATAETEFKDFDPNRNYSTADHFNARCYHQPVTRIRVGSKQAVHSLLWEPLYGEYKMPDGQPFPDEPVNGMYKFWLDSEESDGMADCLKRYKRQKAQQEDMTAAVAKAMQEAAQRISEKLTNDILNGRR